MTMAIHDVVSSKLATLKGVKKAPVLMAMGVSLPLAAVAAKKDAFSSENAKKGAKAATVLAGIAAVGVAVASVVLGKKGGYQGKEMLTKGFGLFKEAVKEYSGKGMEAVKKFTAPAREKGAELWGKFSAFAKETFDAVKSKFAKPEVTETAMAVIK